MKEAAASILLISGCQDNQLSADGEVNGLFTGEPRRGVARGGRRRRSRGGGRSRCEGAGRLLDRSGSPNAESSRLDHHEIAGNLPFFERLDRIQDLLVKDGCRHFVREMRDQDACVTAGRVGKDVRETPVSRDENRASFLGRPEDLVIWTATQPDVPHVEDFVSC